jgi:hypothetical protein
MLRRIHNDRRESQVSAEHRLGAGYGVMQRTLDGPEPVHNYAGEYFALLERLIGRPENRLTRVPEPPVYALFFENWPADGMLSAFTPGVGLSRHVDVVLGRILG